MIDRLTIDVLDAHTHVISTLWELDQVGIRLFYANRRAREVCGFDPRTQEVYLCDLLEEREDMCQYAREMMRIANCGGYRVAEVRPTPWGTMFVEGQQLGRWILYIAYELQALADEMGDYAAG